MENERLNTEGLPFTAEQLQAAYALNLCTVSVSQIIDYNDMTVLDQEYETILNNLNLEHMPKDDALLEIIKRLMETITFFRMQEGEKEFIEQEYQQKMKNAIWTAVPNLALLVAGANPVSLAASLAAQVGIGYMNYRKNRAQYHLDRDQQMWKLQRAAMEQFEGLQQQLFETAWRLADKYDFPDAFRLTQRQIRQYNDILMDKDLVRKYERLDSVKEHFAAYPPFWYYFGNTANAIACDEELSMEPEAREAYRSQARKYFAYFTEANHSHLLREDEIAASCCLEYADLLDPVKDAVKIGELIDDAAKFAGGSMDVHQLCAISYLKIGEKDKAAKELRALVNEDYNAVINAQILSSIYVERFVKSGSLEDKNPYRQLTSRVSSDYLFPMPKTPDIRPDEMQAYFVGRQRNILQSMYSLVLENFLRKYTALLNQIIPLPDAVGLEMEEAKEAEELYLDSKQAREERVSRVKMAFANKNTENGYKAEISEIPYSYKIIELLNQMFSAVRSLDCVSDEQTQLRLQEAVKEALHKNREQVLAVEEKLADFSVEVYEQSLKVTLELLTGDFAAILREVMQEAVRTKSEMQDFAIAQTSLVRFCQKEGLENPEMLYAKKDDASDVAKEKVFFTPDLLSDRAVGQNERVRKNGEMIRMIQNSIDSVVRNKEEVEFYTQEDARMNRYYYNKAMQRYTAVRAKTLAILDDQSKHDYDLLFTTEGVMPVLRGHVKTVVPYKEITWTGNAKKKELRIGVKYDNEHLDMDALFALLQNLAAYSDQA